MLRRPQSRGYFTSVASEMWFAGDKKRQMVHKISTMRHKMQNECPKLPTVAVNVAVVCKMHAKSGYFTSEASEMLWC